jgi:hypothetical protein
MNNFGNKNIGSLLHKLTKYQTLNSNCGSPAKSAIYNQKIAYYSNKLNKIGISSNNINQVGNLIGGSKTGGSKTGDSISSLIQLQTQRIKDKLAGRLPSTSGDVTTYDAKVNEVETEVGNAENRYKTMIKDFVEVLRVLIKQLMELEEAIANMNVPADFDLSAHTTRLQSVINKLKAIAQDDDIAKTYAESLINEINANPQNLIQMGGKRRYQYGGATHKDLLAVELRQLATLLQLNPNETDKQTEVNKLLKLFKYEESDIYPTKLTNTDARNVVYEYVNNKLIDRLKESTSELGRAKENLEQIKLRKDTSVPLARQESDPGAGYAAVPPASASAPAPAGAQEGTP